MATTHAADQSSVLKGFVGPVHMSKRTESVLVPQTFI